MTIIKSKRTTPGKTLGLRARKKARTRAAIQAEALRLFAEQGYEATTCEQIAAAAEVSVATFFRYFPTKEELVLADDYGPLRLRFLDGRTLHDRPIHAIRLAVAEAMAAIWPADAEPIAARIRLLLSVPALRNRMFDLQREAESTAARQIASLFGDDPDDLRVRVITAAVAGAMLAATEFWITNGGDLPAHIDAALALLEEGQFRTDG